MAIVKYKSIVKTTRKVTFDVDGITVVRKVPKKLNVSIDEYIMALAQGLAKEYTTPESDTIETPSYSVSEVLVDTTTEGEEV